MKLKKYKLLIASYLILLPVVVLAETPGLTELRQAAGIAGFGQETDPYVITVRWINGFLSIFTMTAVFFIVSGGFTWMTSGGNADKVLEAKNTIKNTLLGMSIALIAYSLTRYVLYVLAKTTGVW